MILAPWTLLSLPSPPSPVVFEFGHLPLYYHGLFVVAGIIVGAALTGSELARRGYDRTLAFGLLLFVVPLGLIGARLYHVVTEYDRYLGGPLAAYFRVWLGGFGVYGAIAGGFVGLLVFGWIFGIRPLVLADAAAPGVILAQAIGRWGNYFNQELFGRPSDLPWAIRIAPENRPVQFADASTFHPTFLYESVWDLLVCLILLWVARRFADRLKNGDVFFLYLFLYSVGRFFVETLRVDEAFLIWGTVRGNLFVSGLLALGAAMILLLRHAHRYRSRSKNR